MHFEKFSTINYISMLLVIIIGSLYISLSQAYIDVDKFRQLDYGVLDKMRSEFDFMAMKEQCEHIWLETSLRTGSYKRPTIQHDLYGVLIEDYQMIGKYLSRSRDPVPIAFQAFVEKCLDTLRAKNKALIQEVRTMTLTHESIEFMDRVKREFDSISWPYSCSHFWLACHNTFHDHESRLLPTKPLVVEELQLVRGWLMRSCPNDATCAQLANYIQSCSSVNWYELEPSHYSAIGSQNVNLPSIQVDLHSRGLMTYQQQQQQSPSIAEFIIRKELSQHNIPLEPVLIGQQIIQSFETLNLDALSNHIKQLTGFNKLENCGHAWQHISQQLHHHSIIQGPHPDNINLNEMQSFLAWLLYGKETETMVALKEFMKQCVFLIGNSRGLTDYNIIQQIKSHQPIKSNCPSQECYEKSKRHGLLGLAKSLEKKIHNRSRHTIVI